MKKLLLITSIVLSTVSSAFALTDIADSDFKTYIENAQREHIISGYDDDTFRPNNPVSFIESLKIIINTGPQKDNVEDIKGMWYQKFVDYYNQNQKTYEVNFENNEKITRDFAVYLMLRQLGITLDKTDFDKIPVNKNFPDVNKYTALAPYIKFAKYAKITDGYSDGTFWPKNKVSRGELTKMVWRSLRENKQDILQKYQQFQETKYLAKKANLNPKTEQKQPITKPNIQKNHKNSMSDENLNKRDKRDWNSGFAQISEETRKNIADSIYWSNIMWIVNKAKKRWYSLNKTLDWCKTKHFSQQKLNDISYYWNTGEAR